MAMSKIERIEKEIQKTREKITEYQDVYKRQVMDGGKCILQLRGVRPFFSEKYDITKHPKYKYLSDFDKMCIRDRSNIGQGYVLDKKHRRSILASVYHAFRCIAE